MVTLPGLGLSLLLLLSVLPLASCTATAVSAPAAREPAVASPSAAGRPGAPVLRVAFSEPYGGNVALWMAQAAGLFRKHSLEVALAQVDETAALRALAAGELDVTVGNGVPALAAVVAGAELRLVGGLVNTYPHRLMVAPGIEAAADLRGTRLGIGRSGSVSDVATRLVLAELHLEPGSDVMLLQIGSAQERLAALENGAIQGAAVAPPDTVLLERLGFHSLHDLAASGAEAPNNQVIAAARLVREQPVAVQRLVNALVEGTALAKRDRELTRRVLSHYLQTTDETALEETYELFVQKLAPRAPYPAAAAVRRHLRTLAETDPRAAAVDPAVVIDRSFVQQAVDAGYVSHLYGGP